MNSSINRFQGRISTLFALLLLALPLASYSEIYSIIKKVTKSDETYTYDYSIIQWDYDDIKPNPCYGSTSCYVAISHVHTRAGTSGITVAQWSVGGTPCLKSAKTLGELGRCLKISPSDIKGTHPPYLINVRLVIPFSGETYHSGVTAKSECVGLFWATKRIDIDTGATLIPGSVCGLAPPPSGRCSMQDSITLDHGHLSMDNVAGNVALQQVALSCSEPIKGKLFLAGLTGSTLSVGEGIKSTIEIEGTSLGSAGVSVPLKKGVNPLKITSTLSTVGKPAEGEHTGQGVLILTLE